MSDLYYLGKIRMWTKNTESCDVDYSGNTDFDFQMTITQGTKCNPQSNSHSVTYVSEMNFDISKMDI